MMLAYCDCDIAAPAGTGTASDDFLPLRRRNSSKIAAKISNSNTNAPTPTPAGSAQSESAFDAVVKGDSEVTPPAEIVCTVVSGPALVVGGPGSVGERGGIDVATIDVAGVVAVGVFDIEFGTVCDAMGELGIVAVDVDIAGGVDGCGAQHASICTRLASSLLANAERQKAVESERLLLVSRGNVQKDCRWRDAVATVARRRSKIAKQEIGRIHCRFQRGERDCRILPQYYY